MQPSGILTLLSRIIHYNQQDKPGNKLFLDFAHKYFLRDSIYTVSTDSLVIRKLKCEWGSKGQKQNIDISEF